MLQVNDGTYAVRQVVNHDENGKPILGQAVGYFEIAGGKVLRKTGFADEMLRLGAVEGMNEYRITHTFNNGYLTVVPEAYPEEEGME